MGGFAPLDLAGDHVGDRDDLAADLQNLRRRHADRARLHDRPLLLEVIVDLSGTRAQADDELAFRMIDGENDVVETSPFANDADRLRPEIMPGDGPRHRLRFLAADVRLWRLDVVAHARIPRWRSAKRNSNSPSSREFPILTVC